MERDSERSFEQGEASLQLCDPFDFDPLSFDKEFGDLEPTEAEKLEAKWFVIQGTTFSERYKASYAHWKGRTMRDVMR